MRACSATCLQAQEEDLKAAPAAKVGLILLIIKVWILSSLPNRGVIVRALDSFDCSSSQTLWTQEASAPIPAKAMPK
eukprot:176646-Amphidinium_carterae.1